MRGPMQVTKTMQTNAKRKHTYIQKINNVYATTPPVSGANNVKGQIFQVSGHGDLSQWFARGCYLEEVEGIDWAIQLWTYPTAPPGGLA